MEGIFIWTFSDLGGEDGWYGLLWLVTISLEKGTPFNALKKVATWQNSRHSDRAFVKKTLYDALNGLNVEYITPRSAYAKL